ncbi:phosphomannomutase [Xenorhabdus bovienii]|uniref:phosphomannomutase n=1 Tax=Xenorhabdus bovienii TaxID=40576 RepID=UPI0023B3399C|nr:phosphomannomutase [Xenorhabdus bovienii]MDE9461693.1 phosphomannomutase [Xenorhabdus bovienii]MDE9469865.1 phosphomannomutase [Xenorhabdus bovienii]MDE9534059.1 phosphomannomutase [Xenorhabdus bovienii]MDE9586988.1 phosphomannomutase [Xenorhabdus bovienii]
MNNKLNSREIIANSSIAFGTSGARGLVNDFIPDVCAAFTHAFVSVMQKQYKVTQIALAIDNRPSSPDIAMACATALRQADIEPIYYGVVPTPALAYKAMQDGMPCIMVTGSHIPFDRNGLKFYRPDGEITKADEEVILSAEVVFEPLTDMTLLTTLSDAAEAYLNRYRSLFSADLLTGKRIGIYEHSSAGRDLYAPLLRSLGAEVISLERTDEFVPIDTEAVAEEDRIKARNWTNELTLDAIFSTDGDGDRPLLADEHGEWLRGDILGLLCADTLGIEALAVPVSCNSAVQSCNRFANVILTKIGSPYVIAEFKTLSNQFKRIAGFEANGGFLLGSDIDVKGRELAALPTRDALLPALIVLSASKDKRISSLVNALPSRYTHSDRLEEFPTALSQTILDKGTRAPEELLTSLGLDDHYIIHVDLTDGLRMTLDNNIIIHLRPSGNAPELRCYAEADTLCKAKEVVINSLSALATQR